MTHYFRTLLILAGSLLFGSVAAAADDPLPSWNDGKAKQAVMTFVTKVTAEGTPGFIPPAQRIATFDNDGCLWAEQPIYFQVAFVFDRIKALAPQNPEWKTKEPYASVLKGNIKAALAGGERSLLEMATATHSGMTTDEFDAIVTDWVSTARHPKTGRPYTEMVYQPMLELLSYLRANGFKTFIVSGGGIDFMRPWTERVYGIPPQQVVGSSVKTKFEVVDGKPVVMRLPELNFIDDKEGKPVGIQQHIGRRPVMAFGNSDGDFQMLQWTTAGEGPRFAMIIHHTDAEREWAYDRESSIGRLDRGLDEGPKRGWTVVDMKQDWKTIFPAESGQPGGLIGKWLVEDIDGRGVVDNAQTTVEFAADGSVVGNTCVNRFSGKADIDGNSLSFGPLATTRRAGAPALMNQEQRFLQALDAAASYRTGEPGIAYILDSHGEKILKLSQQ